MLNLATQQEYQSDEIKASSFIEGLLMSLKDAKRIAKSAEAKAQAFEKQIKAYMKEAETLIDQDGVILCTWKEQISERFDSLAFKAANSEMYKNFTVCAISRRFLVK